MIGTRNRDTTNQSTRWMRWERGISGQPSIWWGDSSKIFGSRGISNKLLVVHSWFNLLFWSPTIFEMNNHVHMLPGFLWWFATFADVTGMVFSKGNHLERGLISVTPWLFHIAIGQWPIELDDSWWFTHEKHGDFPWLLFEPSELEMSSGDKPPTGADTRDSWCNLWTFEQLLNMME